MVMRDYRITGELGNDHRYETTSKAVGQLLHEQPPAST
jgi:hypothetical protein